MTLQWPLSKLRSTRTLSGRVGAVLAAMALVAGCATTGGEPNTPASPADGEQRSTDTLTIATSFDIDDIDPFENGFWGPEFGYVELLMKPQRDGVATPWVLSDLAQDGDRAWKLTLNDGVTFENGNALNATALAELLNFSKEKNAGFLAASALAEAEATGDLEVTMRTTRPVPDMPSVLADESNVPVFDVATYRRHMDNGADAKELLNAGIYTAP